MSCKITPGSADNFTDSLAETYELPGDSIKVDRTDLVAALLRRLEGIGVLALDRGGGYPHTFPRGLSRKRRLVRELVADGFTIVSGIAAGADRIAHETAIAEDGRTTARINDGEPEMLEKAPKKLVGTL